MNELNKRGDGGAAMNDQQPAVIGPDIFTPPAWEIREPGWGVVASRTTDGRVRISVGPRCNPQETRFVVLTFDEARAVAADILAAADGLRNEYIAAADGLRDDYIAAIEEWSATGEDRVWDAVDENRGMSAEDTSRRVEPE